MHLFVFAQFNTETTMTVAMQEDVASAENRSSTRKTRQLIRSEPGRYYVALVFNGLACLVDMASPRVRHGASPLLSVQQWWDCARVRATPMACAISSSVLHAWPFDDECDNETVLAVVDFINKGDVPSLDFVQRKQTTLALVALRFGVESVCRYADQRVGLASDCDNDKAVQLRAAWDLLRFAVVGFATADAASKQRRDDRRRQQATRKRSAYAPDGPYGNLCTN